MTRGRRCGLPVVAAALPRAITAPPLAVDDRGGSDGADGRQTVNAVEPKSHDVSSMDVQMPTMDGLDPTHASVKRWPDTWLRVVAMTINASQGDRERCIDAGMNDDVAEPIRVDAPMAALFTNANHA